MPAVKKRKELLDAAAHEFIERGYAATSLATVAGRLDLTKGALAHHFPTKRSLLSGLAQTFRESIQESERLTQSAYPDSGLRSAIAFMLQLGATAAKNPQIAAALVLITDRGARTDEFAEVSRTWIGVFARFLDQAKEEGTIREDLNTSEAAQFMLATNIGSTLLPSPPRPNRNRAKRLRFMRLGMQSLGVDNIDEIIDEIIATGAEGTLEMPDIAPSVIPVT